MFDVAARDPPIPNISVPEQMVGCPLLVKEVRGRWSWENQYAADTKSQKAPWAVQEFVFKDKV